MVVRIFAVIMLVAAVSGALFASTSTGDFARHLDRQVHDLHCSFIPGAADAAANDESVGCRVTMMSPYSSVLRQDYWGGLPVSLPGIGTFAFLAVWAVFLLSFASRVGRVAGIWTLLWWLIPAAASGYMARIAFGELGAACKLCIGIYASSGAGLVAALAVTIALWRPRDPDPDPDPESGVAAVATKPPPSWWSAPVAALCVALPILAYVRSLPDVSEYTGGCGDLVAPADGYGVMVDLSDGPVDAIEVLDPLCAACKAFEGRLEISGLSHELGRRGLLFPLDASCNWMVSSSMHPGACSVSEAILCDAESAREILHWAFANQEQIMAAERAREGGAAELVVAQFPAVRGCVGGAEVRSALHRGLRWAVQNELPLSTPQLFIEGRKLCNEDTDLGLEYMLTRLIAWAKESP